MGRSCRRDCRGKLAAGAARRELDGAQPFDVRNRFEDLYRKFAEAWRVDDASSLFDYAPGTSAANYKMLNWPPTDPPCPLPATVPVEGVDQDVAERACAKVVGPSSHDDCVYDVMATGKLGFADGYAGSAQETVTIKYRAGSAH